MTDKVSENTDANEFKLIPEDWAILRAMLMRFLLNRFTEHQSNPLWPYLSADQRKELITNQLMQKIGADLSMFSDTPELMKTDMQKRILFLIQGLWPKINIYMPGADQS